MASCINLGDTYTESYLLLLSDMHTTLVIMAAGMGSRYGGLKQIDTFGPHGETILEYSVYDAIQAGFDKVVIVIRESFHVDFQRVLGEKLSAHIELAYVYQDINPIVTGVDLPPREKPWGTGHAVLAAKDAVDGPFCVINADDRYGRDAYQQMHAYLTTHVTDDSCGMVGYVLKNTLSDHGTVNRGLCEVNETNHLVSIQEHLKIGYRDGKLVDQAGILCKEDAVVSMNFWGFSASMLEVFEREFYRFLEVHKDEPGAEFFITMPPHTFIQEEGKACNVMISHDKRHGVTYAEDKHLVEKAIGEYIAAGLYPEHLWHTR